MKCFVLNAQSLGNKGPDFVDYIYDSGVDIAVITETWLKSENAAVKIAVSKLFLTNWLCFRNRAAKMA